MNPINPTMKISEPWLKPGERLKPVLALVPGTALSGVIALAATFVSTLHGGPQLLYALFFGVAFHFLSTETKTRQGIEFCASGVLRLGVGLLGVRITASQIAGLGWTTALIVVAAVVTTLLCGSWLGKRLGLTRTTQRMRTAASRSSCTTNSGSARMSSCCGRMAVRCCLRWSRIPGMFSS